VNVPLIDWIWKVRGTLPLAPGQSNDEVFDRLGPLFRERGTSHELASDTLAFRKKDQPAQDKMSVFDRGVLKIERGVAGAVLRYQLTSKSLLFCFLLPLIFVGIAQFTIALGNYQEASAKAESAKADEKKADKKKDVVLPQNWIDKALGAPAPELPKKDKKGAEGEGSKKPSPTPAYVFACIFAVLYVVGRVLEDRLVKRLFKKSLLIA